MRLNRRHLLAGAAALGATPAAACPPSDFGGEGPGDNTFLFFVGNSFTRGHNIPERVSAIAQHSVRYVISDSVIMRGARLHETVSFMPDILLRCSASHATSLILQDFSTEPLTARGRHRSAAAMESLRLTRYPKSFLHPAARLVLFATWARREGHKLYRRAGMPKTPMEMTEIVHAHYAEQAARLGGIVAPVGRAWQRAISTGHELHARDGYHANELGANLTAMVLAHALGFRLPDDPFAEIAVTTPI